MKIHKKSINCAIFEYVINVAIILTIFCNFAADSMISHQNLIVLLESWRQKKTSRVRVRMNSATKPGINYYWSIIYAHLYYSFIYSFCASPRSRDTNKPFLQMYPIRNINTNQWSSILYQ